MSADDLARPGHGLRSRPSRRGYVGMLVGDPVLIILVGVAVLFTLWIYLGGASPRGQQQTLWAMQIPLDLALSVQSLRMCSAPGITRASRRFWRVLGMAAASWALGDTVETVLSVSRTGLDRTIGADLQTGCFLVGFSAVIVVMMRYHAGADRHRRTRFYLDAATVLIGGGVLTWCFGMDHALTGGDLPVGALVGLGLVLVAAFATVKMVMSGWAPMTAAAASPMIAAAVLQAVAIFVTPAGPVAPSAGVVVLRLLPSVLIAIGPRVQYLLARQVHTTFAPRPEKPYSVLPYVTAAAAFAAMVATLTDVLTARRSGAIVGTAAIMAIVVGRQLLSFRDQIALIGRLDGALDGLREHESLLRDQASHDALTRLANRTAFAERVTTLLDVAHPSEDMMLLLIDLDDFKTVNDTLGHGVGDQVLIAVAQRLAAAVAPGDVVARVGGDEFAVLMAGHPRRSPAEGAERVLACLSPSIPAGGHNLPIRASVGVARPTAVDDLESLLRHADIAMYAAKDNGRDGWTEYSPEMGARILETARLGAQLREALDAGDFHVAYQPIVRLPDGGIVGVEALVRWHHAERGVVSPGDFIPVAEATGLIVPLGGWVLRQATRDAARWRDTGGALAGVGVSVNVAGRQLHEPELVQDVARALAESGLPADQLTIEVTESALLDDPRTVRTLHDLRGLGVRLALDDFGTAASSLGLVLTCPVTSLKLDRSFVEGVPAVTRQLAVATAVVQMAQALDLGAVAEGIETPEQAECLHRLGYRRAQGFLFSRPVSAQQLVEDWRDAPADQRVAVPAH